MIYKIDEFQSGYQKSLEFEFLEIFDTKMKISNDILEVIIPTFQRTKHLKEAIDSVMNQNATIETRITVIDNDPFPFNETYKMLKKNFFGKIRYIQNKENYGMVGNWNLALRLSKSNYFVLLHDDDLLNINFLEFTYKIIDNLHPFGLLSNSPFILDNRDNNQNTNKMKSIKSRIYKSLMDNTYKRVKFSEYFFGNVTSPSAMVINREYAIEIGGWGLDEYPSHDYFFNARMGYRYNVYHYNLKIPTSTFRIDINESLNISTQINFIIQYHKFIFFNQKLIYGFIGNLIKRISYTNLDYSLKEVLHPDLKELIKNYRTEIDKHKFNNKIIYKLAIRLYQIYIILKSRNI